MSLRLTSASRDAKRHRDNLDPKGDRTDAELNDALKLITGSSSASHSLREKFRLDASVEAEGQNFSGGEKQLSEAQRTNHTRQLPPGRADPQWL